MDSVEAGKRLWTPTEARCKDAAITAYLEWINQRYDVSLRDYHGLWQWSIDHLEDFWESIWDYYQVGDRSKCVAIVSGEMPECRWFDGARVNYAEHLLRQGDLADPNRVAIYARSESVGDRAISWLELREAVASLATRLREAGVRPGDRVAAYMPISAESVVACLACAAIGAVWSSCSPDFGSKSVLERFAQISPRLMIGVTGYRYNGQCFDRGKDVTDILSQLPSVETFIFLPWGEADSPPKLPEPCKLMDWDFAVSDTGKSYKHFEFEQLPFNAPMLICYSSGTTGPPKGIVHGQGGVLLERIKTSSLHEDLNPQTVEFFFTTTGWVMFNILMSGMLTGSGIAVYDGSPTFPDPGTLWRFAEDCGITYFGTSPTYINALEQSGYVPRDHHKLGSIKSLALTGSPSVPETFQWCYDNVANDLHIISMSGGTEVMTGFLAGCPLLPVYAGELQCACLGVRADVFDERGQSVPEEVDGELVLKAPLPSMPVRFWNDPEGKRYHDAYFAEFPGIWRHGDLVRRTRNNGYVISGRSDSTLNRHGVRIGTAEIYRVLDALPQISDSMIISVELPGARFYMPLFVVLSNDTNLDEDLTQYICNRLRSDCSPRHVPDDVFAIEEVPYTLTGKKLEVPVKKLLLGGEPDRVLNPGAIRNPDAVAYFVEFAKRL
ncbi:MAG: acetoacetate--CoA ligase [Pseudomonadota bacterium]